MNAAKVWPGMIFGLLGVNVCVVAATVYLAHADNSAAVEPDYYRKAVNWDEQRRLDAQSAALGWTMTVSPGPASGAATELEITLVSRDGSPVSDASVQVEAFANTRATGRLRFTLAESSPGTYRGTFDADRSGLWQFRVFAARAGDLFSAAAEAAVPATGSPTP